MENLRLPWSRHYPQFNAPHLNYQSQSQSQGYFTNVCLPPISSSCRQAPWHPRPEIFVFNWTLAAIDLTQHSLWREDGFVSYEYSWPLVKCTYRKHSILIILPFALYTSPVSVQALQSRSCLSYLAHATTAVSHLNDRKLDRRQV
jgi:hypothetical protein